MSPDCLWVFVDPLCQSSACLSHTVAVNSPYSVVDDTCFFLLGSWVFGFP